MKLNKKILAFLSMLAVICILAFTGVSAEDEEEIDYLKIKYNSDEEKLATMELMLEANGSQLYVDRYSGEIGFVDGKTGQILLSNPYDVASSKASDNVKNQLMSQLIIKYEESGTEKTLDSYCAIGYNLKGN